MKKYKLNKILIIFFLTAASVNNAFAFERNPPNFVSNIDPYKAPEIEGATKWLNSEPIKISEQKGKVILVDFFTYSCINCIRTMPALKKLHDKYKNKGLIIIGAHSPEFDFEKDEKNVAMALKKFGIKYAVAMDNELEIWHKYDNEYWPTQYLIDQNGNIVYMHFGEGQYDVMENNVKTLLKIPTSSIKPEQESRLHRLFFKSPTPETYLGADRVERNMNSGPNFVFPKLMLMHHWALNGNWNVTGQYSESLDSKASLRLRFTAKKVFLVASSKDGGAINISVKLNGVKVTKGAGIDVQNSVVKVGESRLYELLNLEKMQEATLEIAADRAGLRVYTFTFE